MTRPLPQRVAESDSTPPAVTPPRDVLYLQHDPTWEYRYLRQHIEGHPQLRSKTLLTSAESSDAIEACRLGDYAVVILGALPGEFFEQHSGVRAQLATYVEEGGKLLCLVGCLSQLPAELHSQLPVSVTTTRSNIEKHSQLTPEGESVCGLSQTDRIEGPFGKISFYDTLAGGLLAKPGSQVWLMDARTDEPLIVAGSRGAGSLVVLGLGDTWRLRANSATAYARLWNGILGI